MKNVAVIGAGNIGTRHLQAISKCQEPIRMYAVEPFPASRETSEKMLAETEGRVVEELHYVSQVEELPTELEAVVVATNSLIRRDITERLLAHAKLRYLILEKVLFPRVEDYEAVGKLLKEKGVKTWVNCTRRSWPYAKTLKSYFEGSESVSLSMYGNMWGIGCNTIHYMDFLAYLSGCTGPVTVDTADLDDEILTSKRSGYIEFTGELRASIGPNRLCLRSLPGTFDGFTIDIESEKRRCHITEQGSKGHNTITELPGGESREEPFQVPYQSGLTNLVLTSLMETGDCPLVRYEDSVKLHVPMIKAFLAKQGLKETDTCKVT